MYRLVSINYDFSYPLQSTLASMQHCALQFNYLPADRLPHCSADRVRK